MVRKLVDWGEPAPGPPGSGIEQIVASTQDVPAANDQGVFAFRAWVHLVGPLGLYLGSPAGFQTVALAGAPLPAPLNGTFRSPTSSMDIPFGDMDLNAAGELVFHASIVTSQTVGTALFRYAQGALSVVAVEGQPVSGEALGVVWAELGGATINASGDIAFSGHVVGAPGAVAIWSNGALQLPVRIGDAAPGAGGGTFAEFDDRVAIDDAGSVVFRSTLSGNSAGVSEGVFRYADGVVTPIVREYDPTPIPDAIVSDLSFQPSVSRSGRVVMPGSVEGPSLDARALFVHDGHALHVMRLAGDPAPGGGFYAEFTSQPSIDSNGRVSFTSELDDGTEALFVARLATQVPAVPPAAWLAATAALLVSGLAGAHRSRARN